MKASGHAWRMAPAIEAPGALEAMQTRACSDWRGVHLVDSAGHWVQQEQAERVVDLTLNFLRDQAA